MRRLVSSLANTVTRICPPAQRGTADDVHANDWHASHARSPQHLSIQELLRPQTSSWRVWSRRCGKM
ncbi:hypothetical protein KIN20_031109 [Parelaphostrongylus tenuis]|uniref:Uncharacterized protein n=1 Tax=Parelaphostrongylus tenuis TaxID=148309 RepID=A0AAD5WGZ9_PARTN|nr:hypothetical protein KIN20_031109 [Parelaphostrongylus tenuis]